MSYMVEMETWRRQVSAWLGPEAQLIHVSSHSSDVRIYRAGTRILKVRRLTPASVSKRPCSLEDEYHLLRRLQNRSPLPLVVPEAVDYHFEPEWEALELTAVEPPITTDPVVAPVKATVAEVWALACAVFQLNRAGVSHGDLTLDNAGRNSTGTMVLLDFDQAVFSHPFRCMLRDFIGVPCQVSAAQYTVWDRVCELGLVARLVRAVQRVRNRLGRARLRDHLAAHQIEGRAKARKDVRLHQLAECWRLAAASGANSPGSNLAYYSLDYSGMHFPGERPWVLRWEMIARGVSFRGKRLVELGCNLGLLSIHANLAGATAVVAADSNREVLDAAVKVAAILGGEVEFRQIDFDQTVDWEAQLGRGDIVTALSLTYWLRDKDRLWHYLAGFPEVIFEGHEPAEEVERRFRTLAFDRIERLGVSERNRPVFHAWRSFPPGHLEFATE